MKQKDFVLIALFGGIAVIFSIVISNAVISPKKTYSQKSEVVDLINVDPFKTDPKYFNKDSVNPTKKITIGDSSNPDIFKSDK